MAYGILKVDNITFTNSGADQATTISGIYRAITSGVTVTGTISGVTIQGTTVSGTTVTGTTANFVSGVFTTQVSGATVTGTQSSFTSGNFVTLSGATATFTSGVIASGTAAAPSLSILGDPNTGLYSPGADQVALATAGAGRLFIESDGRVGVGAANTTGGINLEIIGSTPTLRVTGTSASNAKFELVSVAAVLWSQICSGSDGSLSFNKNGVEQMRLDSSGRLGLGTSSPSYALDIVGSSGVGLQILENTSANTRRLRITQESTGVTYDATYGTGDNAHRWLIGGSERMRIDSNGSVGIGTSSPAQKLDVSGVIRGGDVSSVNGSLILEGLYSGSDVINTFGSQHSSSATVIGYGVRPRNGTAGYTSTAGNASFVRGAIEVGGVDGPLKVLYAGTSTTPIGNVIAMSEAMRIDSSGRVGIGTSSPVTLLDISVAGGMARIGSGSGNNLIQAYTGAVGIGMWAGGNPRFYSTGGMIFSVNSTVGTSAPTGYVDAMTIDSSGRVGIGNSSPNTLLHVLGGDLKVQKSSATLDSVSEITLSNVYRTGRILSSYTNPASIAETYIAFHTNRTGEPNDTVGEAMRIAGGNVGIGTTSSGLRLTVSGGDTTNFGVNGTTKGIRFDFDATQSTIYGVDNSFFASYQPLRIGGSITQLMYGGVEAMRIDSSGRVGIGTSSPAEKLHVNGNIALDTEVLSTPKYINFRANSIATEYGGIRWYNFQWNNTIRAAITSGPDATVASGYLAFSTGLLGLDATEKMRIDRDGRVGIGTSAPGANHALEINGVQKYLAVTANAGGGGTVNPSTSSGLFFSWNRSNGEGESNIIYGTGAGATPGLAIGAWNGTTYTERLRIDSSGRLLVGTSSARLISSAFLGGGGAIAELQVEGTTLAMGSFASNRNDGFGPYLALVKSRGTAAGSFTLVSNGDGIGALSFNGTDGSAALVGAAISAFVDGTPGANDMPGRLVFSTTADGASSPTERMRIDSAGDMLLGATTSLARLTIEKAFGGGTAIDTNTTTASTTYNAAVFRHNSTAVGQIAVSTTATSYITSSDYRLKENVTAVIDGITRLQQLKPSRFNFIADPNHAVDGFIAHEAQAVVPECVTGEKDAVDDDGNPVYQGIDQSKMVPLAVAAIQECVKRIEDLEGRLTAAGL